MIDLHAHVLPGLDDGPQNMAQALELCRIAVDRGTSAMVATPHMFDGVYNVTRDQILTGVSELKRALASENIALEISPGGDVHAHTDLIALAKAGKVMTIGNGGKYLLLEFNPLTIPSHIEQMLFSLRLMGLTPIITHPERNLEVQRHIDLLLPLIRAGNLVQITAASLTGGFGAQARRCAKELVLRHMAHLVASDTHSAYKRPPGLVRAQATVEKLLGSEASRRLMVDYPKQIMAGESVNPEEPFERTPQKRRGLLEWLKR